MKWNHSSVLVETRLYRALTAAIADKKQELVSEANSDPDHRRVFIDPDIIIGCYDRKNDILAIIESLRGKRTNVNASQAVLQVVARALWAAGFGCRARLLPSHFSELARYSRRASTTQARVSYRSLRRTAREVFTQELASELDAKLRSVNDDGTALREIAKLLPIGYFALAIAALPTFDDFIQLVGDRIDFDALDDQMSRADEVLKRAEPKKTVLGILATTLEEVRRQHRPSRWFRQLLPRTSFSTNAYADILALNDLSIERRVSSKVRFITGSRALLEIIDTEVSRHIELKVSHDDKDLYVVDAKTSVVRSAEYLLLRCVLPSIAFSDRRESLPEDYGFARNAIGDLELIAKDFETKSVKKESVLWNKFYDDLMTTSAYIAVWSRADSKALMYLQSALNNIARFDATVNVITSDVAFAREKIHNFAMLEEQKFTEAVGAARFELSRNTISNSEAKLLLNNTLKIPGVSRWCVIHWNADGDKERFVSLITEQLAAASVHRPIDIAHWSYLLTDERAGMELRLFAASVVLSAGGERMVAECANDLILNDRWKKADLLTKVAMRTLVQSCVAATGELTDKDIETHCQDIESTLKQIHGLNDRFVYECVEAMCSWRAFYLSHRDAMVRAKTWPPRCAPVVSKPLVLLCERSLNRLNAWNAVSVLNTDVKRLLYWDTVKKLLQSVSSHLYQMQDAENLPEGSPVLTERPMNIHDETADIYTSDALAWSSALRPNPTCFDLDIMRKHYAESAEVFKAERYLLRHRDVIEKCLRGANAI